MSNNKTVRVAVGVIVNSGDRVLLTKRPDNVHLGGFWEFPGGKVEPGEPVKDALARELKEELAIEIVSAEPLIQIRHDYPDKSVLLDVWLVTSFSGIAIGNEGQPLEWVGLQSLFSVEESEFPLPDANKTILSALKFPSRQLITGDFTSPSDFEKKLEKALKSGIRFVHLRFDITKYSIEICNEIIELCVNLCEQYDVSLVLNSRLLDVLDSRFDRIFERHLCGIHLTSDDLKALPSLPGIRGVIGASCHNQEEVEKANSLVVDYITISPVAETKSHPGVALLGWEKFSKLTTKTNLPVFALGGLDQDDLLTIRENGGQGVAGITAFWV